VGQPDGFREAHCDCLSKLHAPAGERYDEMSCTAVLMRRDMLEM
jgi:hypothetical protein